MFSNLLDSFFIAREDVPATAIIASHNPLLVAFSFFIISSAAYVALLILRGTGHEGSASRNTNCWLGALALGIGIWAMHFTGMLALHVEMAHTYHLGLTALSITVAVLCAWVVFRNVTRARITPWRIALNAPMLGAGIAGMHYIGMEAMQMDGTIAYIADLFWLSIAIAVLVSAAALAMLRYSTAATQNVSRTLLITAMMFGAAVCSMHYVGIEAAVFLPSADCRFDATQNNMGIALLVLVVSAAFISLALLLHMLHSSAFCKISRQSAMQSFMAATLLFGSILGAGYYVYVNAEKALIEDVQIYLMGIAKTAAGITNGDAHQTITAPEHQNSPAYRKVKKPYLQMLQANPDLAYIYTVVLRGETLHFIIDAEAPKSGQKVETAKVMEEYTDYTPTMLRALKDRRAHVDSQPYTDRWGTFLSAYVPIYTSNKEFIGIVGADMRLDTYQEKLLRVKETLYKVIFAGFLLSLALGVAAWINKKRGFELDNKYRLLVEGMPAVFFNCQNDAFWTMNFINAQVVDVTGYPASDFIRNRVRSFESIIHPEDSGMVRRIIQERFARNQKYEIEYRIICADGTIKWVAEAGASMTNAAGEIYQIEGFIQDISSRKHAELAVYERQRMLELAEEMAGLGHWKIDLKSGTPQWSHQTFVIHGLSPEAPQPSLLDAITFYHPEDQTEVQRVVKDALDKKQSFRLAKRIIRADGQERIVEAYGEPELDVAGNIISVVGTFQDVTEKQLAEKKLQDSNALLERFFNISIDLLGIASLEGNFVRLNRAWESTLGYRLSDLEGQPFMNFVHVDDHAATQQKVAELNSGQSVTRFTNRYLCADGRYKIIEWNANPSVDGLIYFAARDITERATFEAALDHERSRLNNIIAATEAGTWEWNVQTGEVIFNERWAGMLGYSLAELGPLSLEVWQRLTHPEDLQRAMALLEKHFAKELEYYIVEIRMRHKDGHWVWVYDRGKVTAWTDDGKPSIMHGTHIDISESKEAEALRESKEAAEKVAKAKSEFLSNMSHELRTPMHAILNYAALAQKRLASREHEKIDGYVGNILSAGNRLLELLNNLLDLAKAESGTMQMNIAAHDFRDILQQCLVEMGALLSAKSITVTVAEQTKNTQALCDAPRIIQVLVNLLSNAIKFSPAHSEITITLADTTLPGSPQHALCCSISDSGAGIPESERESIFDKFIQSSKTKTGAGGTGLGLSISKEIIDLHGGRIWADNTAQGGAIFYVVLPTPTV
jgi:PAS domain S-box-containing protein